MNYEISCNPDCSMLTVHLNKGQAVVAESAAMVAMTTDVKINTSLQGGVLRAFKRKLLAEETIFQNRFVATVDGQHVKLAPQIMGDIVAYEMKEEEIILKKSAFLASSPGITLNTKYEGLKGMLAHGIFLMKVACPGKGTLFFNTYGACQRIDLEGEMIADDGHVVAYSPSLKFKVRDVKGWKATALSGEGLVLEYYGIGTIFMQTRKEKCLADFLHGFRKEKKPKEKKNRTGGP